MKKNLRGVLSFTALTATTAVGHAQSSVQAYGLLDTSVRYATNAAAGGKSLWSLNDGAYTGSRLGFRGREELGGDLKAVFAIEMGFDPSTGALAQATATPNFGESAAAGGRAWGRESWVGLQSSTYGTLQLGRQYTLPHQFSTKFQPLTNPNSAQLNVFAGHHVPRQDNMVKFNRDFGRLNLAFSRTAGEGNGKAWSAGAGYGGEAFDLVAYVENLDTFNGADTRKLWGTGGAYAITPNLRAYAGYMKQTQRATPQINHVWTAAGTWFVLPAVKLTAVYVEDRQSRVAATGTRQLSILSASYILSKRTDVYVDVDRNRVTGTFPLPSFMATRGAQKGVNLGLRHAF